MSALAAKRDLRRENRYWTPERIVDAFRVFAETMGRPPAINDTDWKAPSRRAEMTPGRLAEAQQAASLGLRLPGPGVVRREFGSWPNGLRAAGFDRPALVPAALHRTPRATQVCPSCGDFVSQIDDVHGWCPACVRERSDLLTAEPAVATRGPAPSLTTCLPTRLGTDGGTSGATPVHRENVAA
jgi:hypothetical protein